MYEFTLTNRVDKRMNVTVDYSPAFFKNFEAKIDTVPVYNRDRLPFTHSFVLPVQILDNDEERVKGQKDAFDERVRQATRKITKMLVPKPNSKSMYCSVCKTKYEDYLRVKYFLSKHTESRSHAKCMNACKYTKKIQEMIRKETLDEESSITQQF